MKFSTKAIHVGQEADPATGATIVPVYQTSTYTQEAVGAHRGFDYSRTINPTRLALEKQLAALEGAEYGSAFASGMAATAAVLNLLSAGDHAIVTDDLYGGTYRLFSRVLARYGLEFTYVDMANVDAVRAAVKPNTKLFWLETPTNPLLKLIDIAAISSLRTQGAAPGTNPVVVVDNTFASPYFQQPLALGADIVVHSTTKYIGGHSDVVGGVAVTNNKDYYDVIKFHQNAVGGVPGPHDAWLTMRGAKTLALRMREHAKNAQAVAEFLEGHPEVERVFYPGLPSHPQHELAKRQMSGFGGMVSFMLKGPEERAIAFANRMRYFSLAESLGGVESLICHPARMTHGSIPKEERDRRGVTDGLLRLSVGIEDVEDLIDDLRTALDQSSPAAASSGSVDMLRR
ncbi:MAG TPA: cystathionine gamma-synthase [Candidatus Baltobacteraceae bacterium]|jgi:cystathionine gamma-synthase/cystathionine gamma-lyase|nr:cystathionine gamma-synthase [Candidatus Baltobacteraceae bacterium]